MPFVASVQARNLFIDHLIQNENLSKKLSELNNYIVTS